MISALANLFYSSFPFRIALGIFLGLLSALYSERNSHAASRDALAYASKTRLQKEAAAEREIQGSATSDFQCRRVSVVSENDKKATAGSDHTADGASKHQDDSGNDAVQVEADKSGAEDMAEIMSGFSTNNNQWRCACEGGFLPAGLLQSMGGAAAVFRMGTGQCYHKQT
jgi:hypothetical protein